GAGGNGGSGGNTTGVGVFVQSATGMCVNVTIANNQGAGGAGTNGGPGGGPGCRGLAAGPAGQSGANGLMLGLNIAIDRAECSLLNTIIASGAGQNCFGQLLDGGHNLSSDGTCGLTNSGSIENVSPLLGPLAYNGGNSLTQTAVPAPQSRAIDGGDDRACPGADQRGLPRPRGVACDIGAVEGSDGALSPWVDLSFGPSAITTQATTRLHLHIMNPSQTAVSGIAFTNLLPAPMLTEANPNVTSDCAAANVLVAPGTNRIVVTGLTLGAGEACDVSLSVRCSVPGGYTNRLGWIISDGTGAVPLDASAICFVMGPPVVTTGEADPGSFTSATVTGSVHPQWAPTAAWFDYGVSTNYDHHTVSTLSPAVDTGFGVTNELSGLKQGTVYHYRLAGSNEMGGTFGEDRVVATMSTGAATALALDGTNAFLVTPDLTPALPTETFTLELWFRAKAAGVLVDERGQAPPAAGWQNTQLEIDGAGTLRARVWNLPALEAGRVGFGEWHHAAIRYDKAALRFTCLLDGMEPMASITGDRTSPAEGGFRQFWAIGLGDTSNLGSGSFFRGEVDEIRIWMVARSTADIRAAMGHRLDGTESSLICYYRLDDGSGAVAVDGSRHGRNGMIGNGAAWVVSEAPIQDWLRISRQPGGTVTLLVVGYPALPYVLSRTADFLDWQPLQTNVTSGLGRCLFADPEPELPAVRFYRAIAIVP
ncbi:MAG TPA: LamG domain-containing protein, partial [Candidatus Saccharimonadales bacterium]|nr:LamG domain-containing protein [Candidatus Saccharimonadales bacterium]